MSATQDAKLNHKFIVASDTKEPFALTFGLDAAALGIKVVIGLDKEFYFDDESDAFSEMRREIEAAVETGIFGANQEDIDNFNYIVHGVAMEEEVIGNDGHPTIRDKGHTGMRLADFCNHRIAKLARLDTVEVAALRLYTAAG